MLQHVTDTAGLLWLAECVREGVLAPRVAPQRPMEQAMEAYADVMRGGLRGRVVFVFDESQTTFNRRLA